MKMTTDVTSPIACSMVDVKNNTLLAREGFAYCYNTNANAETDCVYIFGGLIKNKPNSEEDYRETNELLLYKPATHEITVLQGNEECPSERSGASLAIAGDRLFMFGGFNHSEAWLNDFWTYQLPNGPWRKAEFIVARPSIGGTGTTTGDNKPTGATDLVGTPLPTPRDKATLTAVTTASGTHLWLFGGFGPVPAGGIMDEEEREDVEDDVEDGALEGRKQTTEEREKQDPLRLTWFDDLYCINATPTPDGLYDVKKPMQLNLDSPTPRAAHGATSFLAKNGNWNVVIFGGRDTDGRTNDLSIFDTKTRKWTAYDIDDGECEEDEEEDDGEECEEEIEQREDDNQDEGVETITKDESNNGGNRKDDIAEQVKKNLEAIRKKTTLAELEKEKTAPALLQPWPECRSYMSVCTSQNRWLFIFGGRNETDGELNDLWMFDLENPSNGWYNLESKPEMWPQPRSGAIMLPIHATPADDETHDAHCKVQIVGGCADLQPESMHCSTLYTNGYAFDVNLTAALTMERQPVEQKAVTHGDSDAAALLKAAKKSVMAALKGEDVDGAEKPASRKRSASPTTLETIGEEHKNGNETKRVRCGADD